MEAARHAGRAGVASRAERGHALTGDLIAGVSVALVGIPQSLAYAELAGMPPVQGLYAGALPPLLAGIFASSPYLQTGPVAITSLLTFGALSTQATPGSPEYVQIGLMLAFVVGAVRILLGLLRAGVLAYLMSQPMLLGFVPAAAILIAGSQASKALGSHAPDYDNPLAQAGWALAHPGTWELGALALTAVVVAAVLGGRRLHPLFPGVLVSAIVGILATKLAGYGGEIVKEIPSGLPPFTGDELPFDKLPDLALPGAIIALVGFTEAASISRRFASEDRARWSADREFISQGVANLTSSLSGGFPCGGSFSRSSVNRMSGAKTKLAGAITGLTVLAFLPFAYVLEPLPMAVLGAIVIVAVLGLMRLRPLIRIWAYSPPQAIVAWGTFLATLLLAPRLDRAVMLGIGLSIIVFLWRQLRLDVDVRVKGGALHLAPRGVLWFGSAQKLDEALLAALAEHPEAQSLRLDLTRLGRIDTTGALVLRNVLEQARAAGLEAGLEGVPPQSRKLTEQLLAPNSDPLS